jgi:hypothetical protein
MEMSESLTRLVRPGRPVLPAALALLALGLPVKGTAGGPDASVGAGTESAAAAVEAVERLLARAEQDQCTQELARWLQHPDRFVRASVSDRVRFLAESWGIVTVRSTDAILMVAPDERDAGVANDMAVVLALAAALGYKRAEAGAASLDHLASGLGPAWDRGLLMRLLAQVKPPPPGLAPVLRRICNADQQEEALWARACLIRMGVGTASGLRALAETALGTRIGPAWLPGGLGFIESETPRVGPLSPSQLRAWRALTWLGVHAWPVAPVLSQALPVVRGQDEPISSLPGVECDALSSIGRAGRRGVARLVAVAAAPESPVSVRREALFTLARLTADARVVAPQLLVLLESAPPALRPDVLGALGALGHLNDDVGRAVRERATGDHLPTRCVGILAAGKLCAGSEELAAVVLEAAASPVELERVCAAWALGQSRPQDAPAARVLSDLLADPSLAVRTAGTAALIGWRDLAACVVGRLAASLPPDGALPVVPEAELERLQQVADDLHGIGSLAVEVTDWLKLWLFPGSTAAADYVTTGCFFEFVPPGEALISQKVLALCGATQSPEPAEAALNGFLAARLAEDAGAPVDRVEWLVRYALWAVRRRGTAVGPAGTWTLLRLDGGG